MLRIPDLRGRGSRFWSPAPGSHPGPCTDLSEADLGQAPSPPHPLPRHPASPRGSLPAEPEGLPKSYRVRESLVMTPPAETCLPLCAGKPLWKTVNGSGEPCLRPSRDTGCHVPRHRLPRAPPPPATCPVTACHVPRRHPRCVLSSAFFFRLVPVFCWNCFRKSHPSVCISATSGLPWGHT